MKLLPVGLQAKTIKCELVTDSDGIGYWLIAPNKRLFGEARLLNDQKQVLQKFELNSTWLALEIVEANYELLEKEIREKNPTQLTFKELETAKTNKEEMRLEIESYVRMMIRGFTNMGHPIFNKYRDRLSQLFTENKVFDYQQYLAFVTLKNRVIDAEYVQNIKDNYGEIDAVKVAKHEINVGIPHMTIEELAENAIVSEELIFKLWEFATAENTRSNNTTTENSDTEQGKQEIQTEAPPEVEKIERPSEPQSTI